jgi:hypothetical protein
VIEKYAIAPPRIFSADEKRVVSRVRVNTALSVRGKEEDKLTSRGTGCSVTFIFFTNATGKFILSSFFQTENFKYGCTLNSPA